jgi:hypothetical protein
MTGPEIDKRGANGVFADGVSHRRLPPSMTTREICAQRLRSQLLIASVAKTPADVVARLGAVQAQDYPGALWSIGARLSGVIERDIEQAIADRAIVRTWTMRGTWHFVPAADVRWMLTHLTPRVISASVSREKRDFGLDEKVFAQCRKIFRRMLRGGGRLTRDELYAALERERISTTRQRGYHILWRVAQEGVICFSGRIGKQPAFSLLDEWVPSARVLERPAALAELARRYFRGHGPATAQDFAGWAGLAMSEAREAIESVASELEQARIGDASCWFLPVKRAARSSMRAVHLLPAFDEYLLGYKDRSAVLDRLSAPRVLPPGGGMFLPTLLVNGRVVGTWSRRTGKQAVVVTAKPFTPLTKADIAKLRREVGRYGDFLGLAAELKLTT